MVNASTQKSDKSCTMQYLHMSSLAISSLPQILLVLQAFQTQMLQFVPLNGAINVQYINQAGRFRTKM